MNRIEQNSTLDHQERGSGDGRLELKLTDDLVMAAVVDCDRIASAVDSVLGRIKWRMRYASKRRLHTDILVLCTRARPVVMVDYGGKMPELQERLGFEHLRVMIIDDMIYLIHVTEFSEFIKSSLNSELQHVFCDIGQDPPKIMTQDEDNSTIKQLKSVQTSFSMIFPAGGANIISEPSEGTSHLSDDMALASISGPNNSQSPQFIDLSNFLQDTQLTIPTLNGWLLGYPVIYLFGTNQNTDATYNLSTNFLHVYKVLVSRNNHNCMSYGTQQEELLSFSVPYDLSTRGRNEPWAKEFLTHMEAKLARCRHVWKSLHMEVSEFNPQAFVF